MSRSNKPVSLSACAKRRVYGRRLRVEPLEQRQMMSVSPGAIAGIEGERGLAAAALVAPAATATPLLPGGIVAATVAKGGSVTFTYSAKAGQKIELIMTNSGQSGFDPVAVLSDSTGTAKLRFKSFSNRTFEINRNGVWTVKISDEDMRHAGKITLGLETLVPSSPDAMALKPGGIVRGSIAAPIQKNQYTFTGKAGGCVNLMMTNGGQTGFEATADVFDPKGKFLRRFTQYQDVWLDVGAGKYIVEVRDQDFASKGSFTIGMETVVPASPDAVALTPGGIVSGRIAAPIQKNQYTFQGTQGGSVNLMMTSGAQAGFNATADVYDPRGKFLRRFSQYQDVWLDVGVGKYIVQVRDQDFASAGSFTIGMETVVPVSPDAVSLQSGGIVSGSIDAPIQKNQYTFRGTPGGRVNLMMTSGAQAGFNATADVYDPRGKFLRRFSQYQDVWLDVDVGKYIVEVRDQDFANTGTFTIGMETVVPASPDAVSIALGSATDGDIGSPIQKNQYVLQLDTSTSVDLRLASGGQSGFVPTADVYDATGRFLMRLTPTTPRLNQRLSGSFVIQVRDGDFAHGGTFTLIATPSAG